MPSIFATLDPPFPKVASQESDINTLDFLMAVDAMHPMFDAMGFAFSVTKKDVYGNVAKIRKVYDTNIDRYNTLRPLITDDLEKGSERDVDGATMALLWLRRGLQFISVFMTRIVEDHKAGTKKENLVEFAKKAYEESLKSYHGFIVSKLVSTLLHAVPWRKDIVHSLANGDVAVGEDQVIEDMDVFLSRLFPIVHNIHRMQIELNVDFPDKV